jgi:hypothetical protein
MSDAARLLEFIEESIIAHGGDLGGWTQRTDDEVKIFDGRVSLRAELSESPAPGQAIHAHVFATLHECDDDVLDACLVGVGQEPEEALKNAAAIWLMCVAGPIRSFIDAEPVCMTCQAGVIDGDPSKGYVPGDYGLPGLRAYVGPALSRFLDDAKVQSAFTDTTPWFRFAAESAAPRRVHLAKATITSHGTGWHRDLEVDGHDVSHRDQDFPVSVRAPEYSYMTRFAVFEFPRNSAEIARRAELERAIRYFAEHYAKFPKVDELMETMVREGFDADLVQEVESISTIAFGRNLFEPGGVKYAPTVIRARRDGRVEADVPLMSLPAYTRGRALAARLRETMPENDFQALCLYNAESNAILQLLEQQGEKVDLTGIEMYPSIAPDRETSDATMEAAMGKIRELMAAKRRAHPALKKPWWKFW